MGMTHISKSKKCEEERESEKSYYEVTAIALLLNIPALLWVGVK